MKFGSVMLDDMLDRKWDISAGTIAASIGPSSVVFTGSAISLDIYVCGFMCTPFTPNGLRQACGAGHGLG